MYTSKTILTYLLLKSLFSPMMTSLLIRSAAGVCKYCDCKYDSCSAIFHFIAFVIQAITFEVELDN